jgi:hypothetical protein
METRAKGRRTGGQGGRVLPSQVSPRYNFARMGRISAWAFIVFVSILSSGTFAYGQGIPVAKPLWRVDLGELGLSFHLSSHFLPNPRLNEPLVTMNSIAWGRDGHIVVVFLTQEMGGRQQSLAKIEASTMLHAVSLDAVQGRITANHTWPAASATLDHSYVGANRDGNFVFLQGNAVVVYSPDLQEISRLDLPSDHASSGSSRSWSLLVPPGGDLVFLQHYLNGSFDLHMLSATTLREIRSWDKSDDIQSASGKYLGTRREDGLYVRALDTPWRRIADRPCPGTRQAGQVRFVNEDSLLVAGCGRVQLLRVDGQILFTTQLPKGHPLRGASATIDGRFVAVAADKMSGVTIEALDMYRGRVPWRILVYNTINNSVVSALPFNWQYACAFSPDGSALVLLSGGIVELFSLPQSSR